MKGDQTTSCLMYPLHDVEVPVLPTIYFQLQFKAIS